MEKRFLSKARYSKYPVNVLCDVFSKSEEDIFKMDEFKFGLPEDIEESVDYLLDAAGNRTHPDLLEYRYKKCMTYSEIAKIYNITPARVREIARRSLYKIKRKYKNILFKGLTQYDSDFEKHPFYLIINNDRIEVVNDICINTLNLSTRSNNCLQRSGVKMLSDIVRKFEDYSILKVRNLGKMSMKEIASIAGFKNFNADDYIEFQKSKKQAIDYLKDKIIRYY